MNVPINIIFKVTENNPKQRQVHIKMCRQNLHKPIDEVAALVVPYDRLDFSSVDNLEASLRTIVSYKVLSDLQNESIIPENESNSEIESLDLDDLVGEVISVPFGFDNKLQKIDL
jgi:hypothetical protein